MENITEVSLKKLVNDKWLFKIVVPEAYTINMDPVEGALARIEEIVKRNISQLQSLNLESNEVRLLNEWCNAWNTITDFSNRIGKLIEQAEQNDNLESITLENLLVKLANDTPNTVIDGDKYTTSLNINSCCDSDQSYTLIVEFIKAFRNKYKNDTYFDSAIRNFIYINRDNNYIGQFFSSTEYYRTFPAQFWLEQFIKSIEVDTSLVKGELNHLRETIKSAHAEAIKIQENSKSYCDEQLDDFKSILDSLHDNISRGNKRLADLEAAYKEKLKLEAPETLWNERAEKQIWSITIWFILTVVTTGILIYILSNCLIPIVLEATPKNSLLITPTSMLVLITAFMIYIIKVEIKFLTSSWHLRTVYQQKAALTRFYQALVADGAVISGEERLLIMQSLFSEVSTGLVNNSDKSDLDVVMNSLLKK
ncbi:MAG: DUF6161 domain-containing protein [Veillonella nakazawae]|uniref:DUF6161 domain-containing protein n=1 Tax=Veillonella nakazawae TaxID=2682456 RepID=UPI0039949BAA